MVKTVRYWITLVLALALVLSGCGKGADRHNLPDASEAAKKLANALSQGELSAITFIQNTEDVVADYQTITSGMDGYLPGIEVGEISYDPVAKTASVPLHQTYAFGETKWEFTATATLILQDGTWTTSWAPSIVHPDLDAWGRLRHTRITSDRAPIVDRNGMALVENRQIFQVGLDKTLIDEEEWESSATKIAQLMGVNVENYLKRVADSGPKAYVVAITVRSGLVPEEVTTVPGARVREGIRPLAPTATFADDLLGVSGEATAEVIEASDGEVLPGDIVGLSGLQQRYDKQLRGMRGHRVEIVKRESPAKSESVTPDSDDFTPTEVFLLEAVPGERVKLSLDFDLQTKAETIIDKQPGVASIVVVDLETGGIVASANSQASGVFSVGTYGRYAPGSTFKLAVSLAMLRKGLTPSSTVSCTSELVVNGKKFVNYSQYPSSGLGQITMQHALNESCNTVFISQASQISHQELIDAAGSLGFGTDYDAGFPAFYGSIPETTNEVVWAANFIGQGQVEASPMAMAAISASVGAGRTVIPWLVDGHQPTSTASPLTATEAAQMQELMAGVVNQGTATTLKGVVIGAKTGTAEYGTGTPLKTHAWMTAYDSTYAIAVLIHDGSSGSKDAAPVIKEFLS